jgi:ankyrin repeat protein
MEETKVQNSNLYTACSNGDFESVLCILQQNEKVDINAVNNAYSTPLFVSCRNNYINIVSLLIEHGADVNKPSLRELELTPLCIACDFGHKAIVSLLFQHGADVNKETKNGYIPLDFAIWTGWYDIACLLIQYGSDLDPLKNFVKVCGEKAFLDKFTVEMLKLDMDPQHVLSLLK